MAWKTIFSTKRTWSKKNPEKCIMKIFKIVFIVKCY
jgi:hypothetical protein